MRILHLDGRDVRSDKELDRHYRETRAATSSWSVSEWRRKRFNQHCGGFDVQVLDGSGMPVRGNTKLATVRASYTG